MDRLRENPTELLRLVNMGVGGFMIVGAVGNLIKHSFSSIIIGVYMILFGVATIGVEVRTPTEEQKSMIQTYASFMHSFLGRGVFYLLVGILMLNYYIVLYIAGSVVGFVGLAYIGLHFMPIIEPPSTMRAPPVEADPESQRLSGA